MTTRSRNQQQQQQQSKVLQELSSLVFAILQFPPPLQQTPLFNDLESSRVSSIGSREAARVMSWKKQCSPAGFASLLLGVSMVLMMCGSVTFLIGFILMPWVLGLVMVFYFVGVLSNLSGVGRAILCPTSRKELPGM
ncbi:hypothetical protein GIB67_025698 [Kingdonia uniflora]|uniref:Transmembrane protein n=1 Tax=Kingdonia uniflora TaxID=39325 RepID=A0A7J7LQB9_9MAGN|nr:hypothetical protein GIB67_025698 [Kingdonia uniflora]